MSKRVALGILMSINGTCAPHEVEPSGELEYVTNRHELYPGYVYELDGCTVVFREDDERNFRLALFGLTDDMNDPDAINGSGMYDGRVGHGTDGYDPDSRNRVPVDDPDIAEFIAEKALYVCDRVRRSSE